MRPLLLLALLGLSSCRPPTEPKPGPIASPGAILQATRARSVWLSEFHGPGDGDHSPFPNPVSIEARQEGERLVVVVTFEREPDPGIHWFGGAYVGLVHFDGDAWQTDRAEGLSAGDWGEPSWANSTYRLSGRRLTIERPARLDFTPNAVGFAVQAVDSLYHGYAFDSYLAATRWPRA